MNQTAYNTTTLASGADPLRLFGASLDKPGYWLEHGSRCAMMFAGVALLQVLLVTLGYKFGVGGNNVVVVWPAAGLLCGFLACTPLRTWPLWIGAAVVGRFAGDMLFVADREPLAPVLFSIASIAEAVMFATFMRKPLEQSYRSNRPLYLLSAFVILGLAATALGGLLGAGFVDVLFNRPGEFWQNWRVWVAADFLGILILTPATAWFLMPQLRQRRALPGIAELVAFLALVLVIGAYVLLSPGAIPPGGLGTAVLALMMAVPLLWSAIRFPYPVGSLVQFLVVLGVIGVATAGAGPFALVGDDFLLIMAEMQIYLIMVVLAILLVSFLLMERQRALNEVRLHRGLGNVLVAMTQRLVAADISDLDASISNVLQEIADFARADRCVLMQIQRDTMRVSATHAWAREGAGEHPAALKNADLSKLPWVMQQFRERGYVAIEAFSAELPVGAEELAAIQKAAPHTEAAVYIGLFTDNELIGAIGCGYARPGVRWSSESLSLMYLVGQLFANVLKRKNSELALGQYREKLRSLAAEVTITEERARRRTAIDLHDGIGQNLAVARMKVGQLLAQSDGNQVELTAIRNLVDDALRGTKHIIADLSPTILYELGLVPALQSLAERFETANDLSCTVGEEGTAWSPGNDTRITVYRSVQELLNNVARHAQAESVSVDVTWSEQRLDIAVADDGVGLDTQRLSEPSSEQGGFGLFSVREGIELLGGEFRINSARGLGTTAHISVPRREEEDEE